MLHKSEVMHRLCTRYVSTTYHVHHIIELGEVMDDRAQVLSRLPSSALAVLIVSRTQDSRRLAHYRRTLTMTAPFHRLLAYYSNRSDSPDTQTIRLQDSLRGNLALGLDFPVALGLAIGRHMWLRNTGFFSLNVHVPSVSVTKTLLDGVAIDEKREYTRAEIVAAARPNGVISQGDALGLWALASDVESGLLKGEDVVSFQRGTLLEKIEQRRKDRSQVLPFYRGGPISVAGHSWFVQQLFGVQVYQGDTKRD